VSQEEDQIMEEAIRRCQDDEISREEVRETLKRLSDETRRKFHSRIIRFHVGGKLHPFDTGP